MKLRTSLLAIIAAAIVPVIVVALFAAFWLVQAQRENFVVAVKDRNRAFMSAVDSQLKGSISTLLALTSAQSLEADDLRRFHDDAAAVLRTQPDWLDIALLAPDGRFLVRAAVPFGAELPGESGQPESLQQALRSRSPVVGNVVATPRLVDSPGIPVRVPVLRDTQVRYVLTAVLRADGFQNLIAEQELPAGWVSGLVDRDGRFIARVPYKEVGSFSSDDYRAAIARTGEGWYRGRTVEGHDTFTAHTRSGLSGWTIGFAIPAELVTGAAQRAAWLLTLGILGAIALSLGVAIWLAGRIVRPVDSLAAAAAELGTGSVPEPVDMPISELRKLSDAFAKAGGELKRREQALRESEQLFRLTQEMGLQGFALFRPVRDADGRVIELTTEYVNPAGATLVGGKPDALAGRSARQLFDAPGEQAISAGLQRVAETGESLDTEACHERGGNERWFRHFAVRIGERVASCFFEISEAKKLEEYLRQRADELRRTADSRSQFLALLSHELRNPLAPLQYGLALLAGRHDPETVARMREMMQRQVAHLKRLIDDLLDVSRIDLGKLELHRERVSLEDVVRTAADAARPEIQARSHELVVRQPDMPVFVEGDPVRLSQVVANLLNNAAKFTPEGGHIEVSTHAQDGAAVITVRDNGCGFPAGDQIRIFDMFVQLEPNLRTGGGLGIGRTSHSSTSACRASVASNSRRGSGVTPGGATCDWSL